MKPYVIINPTSRGGTALSIWPGLKKELKAKIGDFSFALTQQSGHAEDLARTALFSGFDWIIAIGGDGTLSDVANGFFKGDESVNPEAVFSFLMLGTGSDFQRNFNLSYDLLEKIDQLEKAPVRDIDLGKVTYQDFSGNTKERRFINVASFGLSGDVDLAVNKARFLKIFGGLAVFFIYTILTRLKYQHPTVAIKFNERTEELEILSLAVANGRYFGGGMQVAPKATIDDGLFEVVILKKRSLVDFLLTSPKIYFGKHVGHPQNEFWQSTELTAESESRVVVDIDGEPLGTLPARFEILPKALRIKI
ncbi:MAG: diacylglycerol kinase family lipid kinase [SAR324 cluster bacterium]|nr:diacylglycerol kinase family lipid kinase [SAR324 cluster bacterium]